MKVAARMDQIPFSGIRIIFEEVIRREKMGQKLIHLNIGRPDFDTPAHIKEAAKKALDDGQVHYSSNYGIPNCETLWRRNSSRKTIFPMTPTRRSS